MAAPRKTEHRKPRTFQLTASNDAWILAIRPQIRSLIMNDILDALRRKCPNPNDLGLVIAHLGSTEKETQIS